MDIDEHMSEQAAQNVSWSPWTYAIGVGANLGNRAATIAAAADLLQDSGLALVVRKTPLIETEPFGGPEQPRYLNGIWLVESRLGPHQLLDVLQRIEARLGRERLVTWGPRTIDLDILLRDDGVVIESAVLSVPHPRLHERRFVLDPLNMVAGNWRHPVLHQTVAELAAALAGGTLACVDLTNSIPTGSRQA